MNDVYNKNNNTNHKVYVGAWLDPKTFETHYLRHQGPEHILAFAPTRSGKGVGLVIPSLLSWTGSVVIHDIKGENWSLTSGWRKEVLGGICLKFDPAGSMGDSVCFNPLEEIRLGTIYEVKDVQNIASMIVDPDGKGLNDHWAKTGFSLLVGTIIHVLYAEKDKTLRGVVSYLSNPNFKNLEDIFINMINTVHDPQNIYNWNDYQDNKTNTHPLVAACAKDMLNKSENERSGVLSTAMSFLNIYRDPIVAKNTSKSEFKIRDLMHHQKPVSLYIIAPPSDKDRLKPLFRLLINQIIRTLTENIDPYNHPLLLMIDEFASLGKLDIVAESLSFIAGYGLKAYLITQDLSQIYSAYGRDESIIANCHIRVAFAPNKLETAQVLSNMLGQMTILKEHQSQSGKKSDFYLNHISKSEQFYQRPLLTPDEVMRLDKDDALVFVSGHRPILAKKIKYYQDPVFKQRANIPSPKVSDFIYHNQANKDDKSSIKISSPSISEENF
jgi:type IV secretion system protein VirD4